MPTRIATTSTPYSINTNAYQQALANAIAARMSRVNTLGNQAIQMQESRRRYELGKGQLRNQRRQIFGQTAAALATAPMTSIFGQALSYPASLIYGLGQENLPVEASGINANPTGGYDNSADIQAILNLYNDPALKDYPDVLDFGWSGPTWSKGLGAEMKRNIMGRCLGGTCGR